MFGRKKAKLADAKKQTAPKRPEKKKAPDTSPAEKHKAQGDSNRERRKYTPAV
jgi:hypothetical protein